jgi:hypothetical protein
LLLGLVCFEVYIPRTTLLVTGQTRQLVLVE